MGFIKRTAVATAMATAVVGMMGQGAAFGAGYAHFIGTLTVAPGWTTTCTVQASLTFDSAVVEYVSTSPPTVSATSSTHFVGSSNGCETVASGRGSGNFWGVLAGPVTYDRTGNVMTLGGTINGGAILAGVCILGPTDTNPTTTAGVECWISTS